MSKDNNDKNIVEHKSITRGQLIGIAIMLAIVGTGFYIYQYQIIDTTIYENKIKDWLMINFDTRGNRQKQLDFLDTADCNDLETFMEEGKKEQSRVLHHFTFEKDPNSDTMKSKVEKFTVSKDLVPTAQQYFDDKCVEKIYAFEYENDVFNQSDEIIAKDVKLKFYDMEMNEINPEYWYSNCLDMDCEKTEPDKTRDTIVVPIEDDVVYFTIQHNSTMYIDAQEIVDRNQNILGFEYKTIDKVGEFVFEMDAESLRHYYQTYTELLPMTHLYLFGFEESEVEIDIPHELVYEEPEIVKPELTADELAIEMPQSVLDMVIFLNGYPQVTGEQGQILMEYAVQAERNAITEETNYDARKVMGVLIG